MNPDDKKKLKHNFMEIVRTVKVDEVVDYIFAKDVLTEDDMDQLDMNISGMTQRAATRRLLRILPKRGARAFAVFMEALREEDIHSWLADKIEETDVSALPLVDEVDNFTEEEKLKQMKNQLLDQAAMMSDLYREREEYKKQLQEVKRTVNPTDAVKSLMHNYGLTESAVVDFIKLYVAEGLGGLEKEKKLRKGTDAESAVAKGAVAFDESDSYEMTEEEVIARTIGRYIVHYVMFNHGSESSAAPKAPDVYSDRMRRVISESLDIYEGAFQQILSKLQIEEINGFDTLTRIGTEMFKEGKPNWGRVIIFYAFGGYIAKNFSTNDDASVVDSFGNFFGFFIARHLGDWIKTEGGWDAFLQKFPMEENSEKPSWRSTIMTVFGLAGMFFGQNFSGGNPPKLFE